MYRQYVLTFYHKAPAWPYEKRTDGQNFDSQDDAIARK